MLARSAFISQAGITANAAVASARRRRSAESVRVRRSRRVDRWLAFVCIEEPTEEESDMNPYAIVGSGIDSAEAASCRSRLMAWHDAMVAHERRLRSGRTTDTCDDECPHVEARALWAEVTALLGPRASELTFLRSRALGASASSDPGAPSHDAARVSRPQPTMRNVVAGQPAGRVLRSEYG